MTNITYRCHKGKSKEDFKHPWIGYENSYEIINDIPYADGFDQLKKLLLNFRDEVADSLERELKLVHPKTEDYIKLFNWDPILQVKSRLIFALDIIRVVIHKYCLYDPNAQTAGFG